MEQVILILAPKPWLESISSSNCNALLQVLQELIFASAVFKLCKSNTAYRVCNLSSFERSSWISSPLSISSSDRIIFLFFIFKSSQNSSWEAFTWDPIWNLSDMKFQTGLSVASVHMKFSYRFRLLTALILKFF